MTERHEAVGEAQPASVGEAEALDSTPADLLDTPLEDVEGLDEEDLEEAAAIEAGVSAEHEFGLPGRPINRRSPFYVGITGALGVAVAAAGVWGLYTIRHLVLLLGLALVLAVGLDPPARWLQRWVPRWLAVLLVVAVAVGVLAGFLALVVPVIVAESRHLPHYLTNLSKPHTALGRLNAHYHLTTRLQKFVSGDSLVNGVIGVGRVVIGVLTGTLIVVVITIYLLADMPRVKRGIYQMTPRSRRARVVLLTDEIFDKVGGFVLGNLVISAISGLLTFLWAVIFGIPFPLLLGSLVALLNLVPIVGFILGGLIVSLVALSVSVPVAIATVAFVVIYLVAKDYLLTPRIMGRTVRVPGLITVVAVVVGGSLAGIIGALVAIPVAATVMLLVQELGVPRLDRT
ncbi:MAG: AI-2E family transporter [Acidimicrobiales bacterium]